MICVPIRVLLLCHPGLDPPTPWPEQAGSRINFLSSKYKTRSRVPTGRQRGEKSFTKTIPSLPAWEQDSDQ